MMQPVMKSLSVVLLHLNVLARIKIQNRDHCQEDDCCFDQCTRRVEVGGSCSSASSPETAMGLE